MRRRPPDPRARPPALGRGRWGGAAEAHGGPGCPSARSWQPWACLPVAWLWGRGWGRGSRTLLVGGISSSSPALRGLELGVSQLLAVSFLLGEVCPALLGEVP